MVIRMGKKLIEEETVLALSAGRGEDGAIDDLVETMWPVVQSRVRCIVPIDDADDVIQDIWLQLCRSIGVFEGRSSFRTWFYQIIRNRIAEYYRCRERYHGKLELYEANSSPRQKITESESGLEPGADIDLVELFSHIPAIYQDILWGRLVEGHNLVDYAVVNSKEYECLRSNYRRGVAWCRSHRELLGLPLDL